MDNLVKDSEERKRLYERHREELSKRQISNAENLDKSILTYSAAGLALSLGFLKDFIPISQAKYAWMLYGSLAGFTFSGGAGGAAGGGGRGGRGRRRGGAE